MKCTAEFKFTIAFLPALLSIIMFSSPVNASFEPLPVGGRPAGMGEAYTAIADDIFSLYYNPAGILQINRPELGSYYSQLFSGLTDNSQISRSYIAYAQPLGAKGRLGGVGAGYLALNLPGLYREEVISLTYGREYKKLFNIGGTLKYLRKEVGTDEYSGNAIDPTSGASLGTADPLLAKGRSATAFSLDLGLQYRLNRAYAFGVALRNLNSPDVSLGSQKDVAPAIIAAALARKLRTGSLDFEVTQWKSASSNLRFSVGGEHWFKNGFGLRVGSGFGSREYSALSAGASYKMESIQFDYALIYPLQGIQGTIGTQQVSLTVRLGKPPVDSIEKQLMKEKEDRIRAETEARYAKAERDRLKAQLLMLTEAKSQVEQELEKKNAEQALEEAKTQTIEAQKSRQDRSDSSDRSIFNRYTAVLADYNNRVSQGISLIEKKTLLEKILNDFEGKGVDTSTVTRELKNIRSEEAKAKKDFELSMNFYRRLAQQGASVDERRSMLERIVQKYKGTGINTDMAQEELNGLNK